MALADKALIRPHGTPAALQRVRGARRGRSYGFVPDLLRCRRQVIQVQLITFQVVLRRKFLIRRNLREDPLESALKRYALSPRSKYVTLAYLRCVLRLRYEPKHQLHLWRVP